MSKLPSGAAKDKASKKQIDWERIEADYRAGLLSVREIAEANGISHTAIQKKAKDKNWERDLSAKIQAKADALVAKEEVASLVATERASNDKAIIEANAKVIADIRLAHRTDINRSRNLLMMLLGELEQTTGNLELFEQLAELLYDTGEESTEAQQQAQAKRIELFNRVLSTSSRADTIKKITDSLKTLIALEREAYSIVSEQQTVQVESKTTFTDLGTDYGKYTTHLKTKFNINLDLSD